MALYDRDYANESLQTSEAGAKTALSSFIKKTYQLFAASLLAGSVGAYVGLGAAYIFTTNWFYIGGIIVWFALSFGLYAAKKVNGLNYVLLFAFTFLGGFLLTPFLGGFLQTPAGAAIVINAFVLTTVAFGALSIFAMNTKKSFSAWGKFLFIALIVLVAAIIINIFIPSPILYTVISAAGAILFSIYIIYDTQNIIKGAYETPIEGAIALYLDFLNLFIFILRLLGIFGSDE
ncbi:MAG: Bax inhibitor-1/YccA family protein [Campylobacteraceae bacterium]|jgi:modulator of FtsH protease|nr:Bax inhibitor-1/YccA family protein [Campylobacteraceae bacterium]